MRKLKVMTIVGTRPEIIKLSEVIKKCDTYFDHILVHTGQNYDYELNRVFFDELGLRVPDHHLGVVGENLGRTIGNIIGLSYEAMVQYRPDAVLLLGDTNSALCAIAAKRLKIPIFHMEAGNRCFDENLPEEVNRRIIDHTSDVNLPYTEHARRYLLAEGIKPEYTFVTGSPMAEVLQVNRKKIDDSDALAKLGVEAREYIVLSAHREENIDIEENFFSLMHAVNAMAEAYQMPVIYSMHPRSCAFIQARAFQFHPLIRAGKPLGFCDYVKLQKEAFCVVSDSGTLAEEASHFGFPAVSIRTSTERPEAIDQGNFIIGSITDDALLQAIDLVTVMHADGLCGSEVADYVDTTCSSKVINIVQSYVSIINTMVWRKGKAKR